MRANILLPAYVSVSTQRLYPSFSAHCGLLSRGDGIMGGGALNPVGPCPLVPNDAAAAVLLLLVLLPTPPDRSEL